MDILFAPPGINRVAHPHGVQAQITRDDATHAACGFGHCWAERPYDGYTDEAKTQTPCGEVQIIWKVKNPAPLSLEMRLVLEKAEEVMGDAIIASARRMGFRG